MANTIVLKVFFDGTGNNRFLDTDPVVESENNPSNISNLYDNVKTGTVGSVETQSYGDSALNS